MPELIPDWAECRAAAEAVERAPLGRQALAIVRPRGPIGVIRRRGPLALQLYVAARDQLLVWRGPESLALLQTPAEKRSPLAAPGWRLGVLRILVRHWDTVLFAGPATLLLGVAGVAALVVAGGGGRTAGLFGVLFALGAILHVLVLMVALVVTATVRMTAGLFRGVPAGDEVAADLMPGRHWTLVLAHHVEPSGAGRLLGAVDRHLARVLLHRLHEDGVEEGVRIVGAVPTEDVVALRNAATTRPMRDVIAGWTEQQTDSRIAIRLSEYRPIAPPTRIFESGGFLAWYAGGLLTVLAMLARIVADRERAACGTDCAGRPATYGAAVRWLFQRLLLSDPYGLSPATRPAWIAGWLVSVAAVVGVFVAVAALQQHLRARRARLAQWKRTEGRFMPSHTLIMVATEAEYRAVSAAVTAVSNSRPVDEFRPHQVVTRLGTIERTRISLVQVEPGTVGPGSAAIAAAALVSQLEPDFLILTGICFGLRPDRHDFGDVLVSTQLRAIDLRKVAEPLDAPALPKARTAAEAAAKIAGTEPPPGEPVEIIRGDFVTPSPMLLGRFRAAARQVEEFDVHFGPMLSANTLVSSRRLRDELHRKHPDAIGGEMEGAGVYAAAAHAKVDWIVVKAICDWGFDKTDDHHRTAAEHAATLIVRAAQSGALDDAPARGAI
jgi:nucleoside phosphorylase